jgi:hypothetical protein
MTDFDNWHTKNWPLERVVAHEDCWDELKEAFEAGAASQAEDLRDKFAGKAMIYIMGDSRVKTYYFGSVESYKMADAMLEARKVTKEQGS